MLPTQQTPPLVNYYAEQWPRYVKLCVDYANEITQFSVSELAVIGQEDGGGKAYWGVFPQQCENQLYDNLRKQAENIVDRLVSLATESFLAWAEIDLDLPGLQRLKHRFNGPCQVNSRENIRVVNGLNIITFQYRFEFRFSGELADKIALFIGLYGSHAMGIAA